MNAKYTSLLSFFCVASLHAAKLPDMEKYRFSKNTCHRTWFGSSLSTDEERKQYQECSYPRIEVYDQVAKKHCAHIVYEPTNNLSKCFIRYLLVDDEYRRQGIGQTLTKQAFEDFIKHGCNKINLSSTTDSIGFWKKLGAKPEGNFNWYVFNLKENVDCFSVEKLIFFTDL